MRTIQVLLITGCLFCGSLLASGMQQERQKRPVTRAKKPEFQKQDWDGIFFQDIFTEGLNGQRPAQGKPESASTAAATTNESSATTEMSWTALVSGNELENEVKRWQLVLDDAVTSPVKFRTTHQEVSEQFSMLAMWFTIISQYEGDVRWNEDAHSVRAAFMDAARKSRATDMAAFNNVKRRTEDLTELVRGGKFPEEPGATEEIGDWSQIVDRNPIMTRLELSVSEELKIPTASEKDLKDNVEVVIHEAGMIAAMGRVLQLPEMLDADDEDYNAWAQEMLAAALDMKAAAEVNSLDGVNQALNRINQSCTNCHGDYR